MDALENMLAMLLPEPSRYERHKIHPVILVPIFAPIMMLIACATFIIPEFTKPTIITVVAPDDCIMAVTTVPSSSPFAGVLVSLYSMFSILLPATFFKLSPIMDIP